MRFLLVLWVLSIPYIFYISLQPQHNEILPLMVAAFLFVLFILAINYNITDIRKHWRTLQKDYPPNKQSRRVGGIILFFVEGMTILSMPYIFYIAMQPQRNEIEQGMIGVFGIFIIIGVIKDGNTEIRRDIAEYKKQKKALSQYQSRRGRRVGGIFLVFVVGMTILGVLLTNYISQSI
jgi:uncharacterized membrane protein